jgi:hypothetical protein
MNLDDLEKLVDAVELVNWEVCLVKVADLAKLIKVVKAARNLHWADKGAELTEALDGLEK